MIVEAVEMVVEESLKWEDLDENENSDKLLYDSPRYLRTRQRSRTSGAVQGTEVGLCVVDFIIR